jgi:hypothetical protein
MTKRILQIILFALVAVILSALSMFIKMGADTTQSKTVGVIFQWGFPIHYRSTASGWTWAQFDGARFWLNSLSWFAVLMSIRIITALRRRFM